MEVWTLSGEAVNATSTPQKPDAVKHERTREAWNGKILPHTFAPLSLTSIKFPGAIR